MHLTVIDSVHGGTQRLSASSCAHAQKPALHIAAQPRRASDPHDEGRVRCGPATRRTAAAHRGHCDHPRTGQEIGKTSEPHNDVEHEMSSKAKPSEDFLALRILLTEDCNLSCVFCHNEGQLGLTRTSKLSAGNLRTLLNAGLMRHLRQVKFSGGEPTLHPELHDFVTISMDSGLDTVVISNGVRNHDLQAVAAAGARVCINVPSVDPAIYRKLTGGQFEQIVRTLSALADRGAEVAINSYAKPTPDIDHIRSLIALARTYGCTLKLLLPCQISSVEKQQKYRSDYADALTLLECSLDSETPYDSCWTSDQQRKIRIVQPWCPRACKAVAGYYKSLRLAADLTFIPCFGGSSLRVPVDLSSERSCGAALDRALSLTANGCGEISGLRILRR